MKKTFVAQRQWNWAVLSAMVWLSARAGGAQPESLAIQASGQSQVRVSWPASLNLVQPQKATNLAATAWQDFGAATNGTNFVDATGGKSFYRLRFLPPTITTQPQSQMVAAGSNATLNVAATGTGPLTIQWRRESTNLVGQTGGSLVLSNVTAAIAGNFTAVISNRAGSITSAVVALNVTPVTPAASPRGIYMATFTGQTNGGLAFFVSSNGTTTVLGFNPGQTQGAFLTNLTFTPSGTFTNSLGQGAALSGTITADTLTGALRGTNGTTVAFTGARKEPTGIQQGNVGYYAGAITGLVSGNIYSILAGDGTAFTFLTGPLLTAGTFGKIDANNNLTSTAYYTLPGATEPSPISIAGNLNPTTHFFQGTASLGPLTLASFNLTRVAAP